MATDRSLKRFAALKNSRKFRDKVRRKSRRFHLEQLEDRRVMAAAPPVFILPNSGVLLNENTPTNPGDTLNVAPQDLTFRFTGVPGINPASIAGGIQLTRAGGDGTFGSNDVVIVPGFIGLGNNNTEVIMRFAETLPDDTYQIQIFGAGASPLQDSNNNPFNGGTNYTLNFRLDLGAQVIAVVPQPVRRVNGVLVMNEVDPANSAQTRSTRNEIYVFFNNDDLNKTEAERVEFYRLYVTRNTLDPNDDLEILPTKVEYDAAADKATLIFGTPGSPLFLDQLISVNGDPDASRSLRLRIGTNENRRLQTTVTPGLVASQTPATQLNLDPGSTFDVSVLSAPFDIGGALTAGVLGSTITYAQAIEALPYDLDWPGGTDEPGHREVPVEAHIGGDGTPPAGGINALFDTEDGIATVAYNFRPDIGFISDGQGGLQPAFNVITELEKQRAREIFDLYSKYSGIQFVETASAGLIVSTGDLRSLDPTTISGPGGVAGLAGLNPFLLQPHAIMDGADFQDQGQDLYGQSWFQVAMHEIGHLLGQGHTYDLPPLTIQGSDASLLFNSPGAEPVFPGDHDIVHMQHMYRPEAKDIDLYKFTLDGTGVLTLETFAERLPNSSQLDTSLRLYQLIGTTITEIARNDDYFSKDSLIQLTLGSGTYYVGVAAAGTDEYDPTIVDSGMGGTTQGNYELKLDFRKSASQSIVDATSTTGIIPDTQAVAFDGDADGTPGGVYNFWFRAVAPAGSAELSGNEARVRFVDKAAPAINDISVFAGSLTLPYHSIDEAIADALPFDIIRIVGNGGADGDLLTLNDNLPYRIGFDDLGNELEDGPALEVPKDVTVVIDGGAIFQMRRSVISAGSTDPSGQSDLSGGALQVQGTPVHYVYFTSLDEDGPNRIGTDYNTNITTVPGPAEWGGIAFKNDLDRADGRFDHERVGVFLNYVNHADIRYGGGQVNVNGDFVVVNPIDMTDARPTVTFNRITRNDDAAMAANPDSFEETNFQAPIYFPTFSGTAAQSTSYTLDYSRIGPDIHGNTLVERLANGTVIGNTTNGLTVRTRTPAGNVLEQMTVAGRFNDTDIVHILQENLVLAGTPGGPIFEADPPPDNLIIAIPLAGSGNFTAGDNVEYRLTYIDLFGNEGAASATFTLPGGVFSSGSAILLTQLPDPTVPNAEFVARRLYRRINGVGANGDANFTLVDQIPSSVSDYIDTKAPTSGFVQTLRVGGGTQRPRLDGSLVIDPSIVVKSDGARIEVDHGANLLAEGLAGQEIIFTSFADDRFGAGGTFDTKNDNASSTPNTPQSGDWGGLFFWSDSKGSIDRAVFAYGGGTSRIEGTFSGFNVIEVHQAVVRVANSEFEFNDDGTGGQGPGDRAGRGANGAATIFVRGAQPVILNNTVISNTGPFININANAMTSDSVVDSGRMRGLIDRESGHIENNGPLVSGNRLRGNTINGMQVRGATLTTESVWDDTDIVHILRDAINVPDFHGYGGLRLESSADESLVVKSAGQTAGFTATGRPLEIDDRIGGTLQVLGQPGFPVVLTSLSDDTVGAGLTPEGAPQVDTDGNGVGGSTLPTIGEVNNGTLIDDDVAVNTVGHFEFRPGPGGFSVNSGVTAQGNTQLFVNQDFIFDFLNFVDIGPNGGAINLATTTITLAPTLISPDLVASEGTFLNANNQTVNWRVETSIPNGQPIVFNTLILNSQAPLGALRFINYLDEDVLAFADDLLYRVGSPGQANFRLFTLDNAERIGFSQGGVYIPGPGLVNATWDGWAADQFADLRTAITGPGTTYTPVGNVDTVDLPPFVDPTLGPVNGLEDITTAMAWTVNPTATTATITSFLELVASNPINSGAAGEWQGITLDRFSNDRNVETILEQEGANSDGTANSVSQKAQPLGGLAGGEKTSDENLRIGFTVHGLINQPTDVDVYSFQGTAGTEVWIDIDRTTHALDAVVELVNNNGIVLARSDNSTAENAGAGGLVGVARKMQKDAPTDGQDFYTTNPRDAGMRLILPGPTGTVSNYFLRVRNNSSNLNATPLVSGTTFGAYQLQVRLREVDEIGGSTVRFAKIANAVNGIRVLGQPIHTPLGGEQTEGAAANDTLATAQNTGNLLNTDRGLMAIAGNLTGATDVDWFRFDLNYTATQGTFTGQALWNMIFDMDYTDGLARPNTAFYVFDSTGRLILTSRDSNVADDVPGPAAGSGVSDLTRGSVGNADPYIGTYAMPAGLGAPLTYYVAVTSDARFPAQEDQFFQAAATSPLFRLEPLDSVKRIVEDHVSSFLTRGTSAAPKTPTLVNAASAVPFNLGDVVMYVNMSADGDTERTQLVTIDPFTGENETDVGVIPIDYHDIAFSFDHRLFALSRDVDDPGIPLKDSQSGNFLEINTGTGAFTNVGDDDIVTNDSRTLLPSNNPNGQAIQFNALAFSDIDAAATLAAERLIAVGNRGDILTSNDPGLNRRRNIAYSLSPTTGAALVDLDIPKIYPQPGANNSMTDAFELGEILTAPRLSVIRDATDAAGLAGFAVTDGLSFSIQTPLSNNVFEFDAGFEVLQTINRATDTVIRDGYFFILDSDANPRSGNETLFQFDTGVVLGVTLSTFSNNIPDGATFTINSGGGIL